MHIFLIRHAETVQSAHRFIKDDHRDFKLSKSGIAQALILKNKLNYLKNPTIYYAPTNRCLQTAALTFPKLKSSFIKAAELGEIDKGFLSAIKKNSSLKLLTTDDWELRFNNIPGKKHSYLYPSGESISQLTARVTIFYKTLLQTVKGDNLVIFSHNGPIKTIIAHSLSKKNLYTSIRIDEGHYVELDLECGKFILSKLNVP